MTKEYKTLDSTGPLEGSAGEEPMYPTDYLNDRTAMPGTGPRLVELPVKDASMAALDAIEREMPGIERHLRLKARQRWVYFEALQEQGFTPQEALDLTACEE